MWPRPDDRALRSIALFVERTLIPSRPNNAQPALSLPGWQSNHNQFGEATNQPPIPCETTTIQPTLILDPLVRNSPIRSGQPLVPRTPAMTEGEELKVTVAKARRSSPSVDRIVRGENARSLASQQRPASIELTEMRLKPQPIRRSNEPASNPIRDQHGSAHADSLHSHPQRSDSIRQAAGATNLFLCGSA